MVTEGKRLGASEQRERETIEGEDEEFQTLVREKHSKVEGLGSCNLFGGKVHLSL